MKTWQKHEKKAAAILKARDQRLYDAVAEIALVYEDDEFKEDVQALGQAPEEYIQKFVRDTPFMTIAELLSAHQTFPDRAKWDELGGGQLRMEWLNTISEQQRRQREASKQDAEGNGDGEGTDESGAGREAAKKTHEGVKFLREELNKAREEIKELRLENKLLRKTNSKLLQAIRQRQAAMA